jgi:hypothetical protein
MVYALIVHNLQDKWQLLRQMLHIMEAVIGALKLSTCLPTNSLICASCKLHPPRATMNATGNSPARSSGYLYEEQLGWQFHWNVLYSRFVASLGVYLRDNCSFLNMWVCLKQVLQFCRRNLH